VSLRKLALDGTRTGLHRGRETQEAGDALDLKVEAVLDGMRA